jgi:hypothetical protein
VASIYRLQERIAAMAWDDRSLDRVEREVIDRHELRSDQRSRLRRFARAFLNGREQRLEDLRDFPSHR